MTYNGKNAYVVNLDPAVSSLPYVPNIDIRDTVDYKGVMKEYVMDEYEWVAVLTWVQTVVLWPLWIYLQLGLIKC